MTTLSSGMEKGRTVDGTGSIAGLNVLADELRQLRQEVQELRDNHAHRQSSVTVTQGESRHEGSPSGMRLDAKRFGDGSLKQISRCPMKKSPCRNASRRASRRETKSSTSSSMGEVAASFSIFSDSRKIDAALMAELPSSLRMQAQVWICDSGSSAHCTNSGVGMTNFRKLTGRQLVVASGQSIPIVGIGDVRVVFIFPGEARPMCVVQLTDVLFVPGLNANLFSLRAMDAKGYEFHGGNLSISMFDGNLTFPARGNLYKMVGFPLTPSRLRLVPSLEKFPVHGCNASPRGGKVDAESKQQRANQAVVTPGRSPVKEVDINFFHSVCAHSHEKLLRATAKSMNFKLNGKLRECEGCMVSKGTRAPIAKQTTNRSDRKLGRVFVDLSGEKEFPAIGGKRYAIVFRDDYSRYMWVYLLRRKSDAVGALEKFLCDTRSDGEVAILRSDGGTEFQGPFQDLCLKQRIHRELTPPHSPQFNGSVERGIVMIENASRAARIQAKHIFHNGHLPERMNHLWGESFNWACHALNMTATTANPGLKSPYEMFHGRPPTRHINAFLRPVVYHSKRSRKAEEHGRHGHYLGPAPNYPSGTCRVRDRETGTVVTTRDVSWCSPCFSPEFCVGTNYRPPSTEQGGKGEGDEQGGKECRSCCKCRCSGAREPADPVETSSGDRLETPGSSGGGASGAGSSSDGESGAESDSDSDDDDDDDSDGDGNVATRGSVVAPGASADAPASPPADPATPDDGHVLPAVEPVSPAVSAGDPVMSSDGPELPSAEPVSEPAVESPVDTAPMRTLRRQLATYNRDTDDAPRTLGRTRARTRRQARESSAPVDDGVEEAKLAVPSRDEEAIAAPGDGGVEEAKQSVTLCEEVDKEMVERVDRDLRTGTKVFYAMLADDRIGKYQAGLQRGGPIGKQRKSVEQEPQTYKGACVSPNKSIWADAMKREFKGLVDNDTFESAALPSGRRPITAKWVYSWKVNHRGEVTRGKARLVARGYMQREGLDYLATFSPTPVPSSIRMIATSALQRDWPLNHWDIEQAFIQSRIDREIFVKLPDGCGPMSGKVMRLNKALYGLRQSPRVFNQLLMQKLLDFGLERCAVDPCIFRLMSPGLKEVSLIVGIYVDDLIVTGKADVCKSLREHLVKSFPTKNLGALSYYLGCEYRRDYEQKTLCVSQTACIDRLAQRFGVTTTSPIPAVSTAALSPRQGEEEACDQPYRELVGGRLWIANATRPDISNAVREVARHAHDPSLRHWEAALKIVQYLKGTRELGITYKKSPLSQLVAFADSSYAESKQDRRSVSGGAVLYAGGVVSWFSRTQHCVTLSTTES